MQALATKLRCTKKVIEELGFYVSDIPRDPPLGAIPGDWYCNLLRIARRKVLLFTAADTLFSFLIPGVKRTDLIEFEALFLRHLEENLRHEGFSEAVMREAIGSPNIQIGRTANRSVLGSMNDFAYLSEYRIARAGGLRGINLLELNKEINRTPMNAIGMRWPIEALTQRLPGAAKIIPIGIKRRTEDSAG